MAGSTPRVGVLALQGAFREHGRSLERLGATVVEVRTPADLEGLDGLVLPGGESTTMDLLLGSSGLRAPLGDAVAAGLPVFGTCAGLILLARDIEDGVEGQRTLAALDVTALRNGYGRQVRSFEGEVALASGGEPIERAGAYASADSGRGCRRTSSGRSCRVAACIVPRAGRSGGNSRDRFMT